MTHKSKRELRRMVDDIEYRLEPNFDAALLILPDQSFDDEDLPNVSTEGIRAHDEETGRREVIVPQHAPTEWWRGGIPLVAESHVAAVWRNMTDKQRARERQHREKQGEPIPPILEE